jgi:type IV pilus assembly protein PilQ
MLRLLLIISGLVVLTGCQHTQKPPATPPRPRVTYSKTHDKEVKAILDLANENRWEEAQAQSKALLEQDPKSAMLQRLDNWVTQQGRQRRAQALEDEIRTIDAKSSPYNPTALSLVTENKDRGLPARKDVRDAIDLIESMPWIPKNFGKTVYEQGPLFDFETVKGAMPKLLEKEVTVHFDKIPLETAIVNLSQSSGINIVADKSLTALTNLLSVNLEKVKLSEFLKYVGRNYDLQFQIGPELVWVVDGKNTNQLMQETRFYKLRKGFILPAQLGAEDITRTATTANNVTTVSESQKFKKFVNDDAPAIPSIERAITNLFTGKYQIDYERNMIVGRGTPEQLDILEKIIKEFDQPIQQVLIEARFITLSKGAFMQLGVLWETGRPPGSARTPQDFTGLVANSQNLQNLGLGIQYTFTNILDQTTLTATISALEQTGESQTLSAPRLSVINNRPASINDGKVQYYYEEYAVQQTVGQYVTASSWVPQGKPTKITSGASLNVLASIAGDGRHILLALNPSVKTDVQVQTYATLTSYNANGQLQNSFDIKLPVYRTQDLATRVVIKSGETVAMGGVLERQTSELVESVPILGSIPYIGVLFRRRTEVDTPRYLLVFVTATILNDSGEGVIIGPEADQPKNK